MRTCKKCGESKSDEFFSKDRKVKSRKRVYVYPQAECKACLVVLSRLRYLTHNSPRRKAAVRNCQLRIKYGLAPGDFEAMLREQAGQCLICQEKMAVPNIDHCHKTGEVRGLLCSNCNTGLGRFKDCKKNLLNAILYLEKHEPKQQNQNQNQK